MNKNTSSKELNEVLRGEEIAVEAYEKIINNIEDSDVKKKLQMIQQDHQSHVDLLASKIQSLGGDAKKSTGMAGLIATTMLSVQSRLSKDDTAKLLRKAYDGEDKGIAMVEEIIKGDLDLDSMRLVKQILSTDHDHLKTINHLFAKYEQ